MKIDVQKLSKTAFKALPHKPTGLTGAEMRFARTHLGLSRRKFAKCLNVSHTAVNKWGLQSYISLKGRGTFTDSEYKTTLRPDAELLKTDDPFDPNHPKFSNDKFWGLATLKGQVIKYGHKMKWQD